MILFRSNQAGQSFSHRRDFLPLLKIIASYPFPKPQIGTKTYKKDWVEFDVTTFTDVILRNALDPKRNSVLFYEVQTDPEDTERLHFTFRKSREGGNSLYLDNLFPFLDALRIRQLFLEMVRHIPHWTYCVSNMISAQMYQEAFQETEHPKKVPFDWLNYFGTEDLEKWHSLEAFESNPYLQTERIHNGLFVQLGNDPTLFKTPEGKKLLINAIDAFL